MPVSVFSLKKKLYTKQCQTFCSPVFILLYLSALWV